MSSGIPAIVSNNDDAFSSSSAWVGAVSNTLTVLFAPSDGTAAVFEHVICCVGEGQVEQGEAGGC